jgi:hypothetical protein
MMYMINDIIQLVPTAKRAWQHLPQKQAIQVSPQMLQVGPGEAGLNGRT